MRPFFFLLAFATGCGPVIATETSNFKTKTSSPVSSRPIVTPSGVGAGAPAAVKPVRDGELLSAFLAKLPGRWSGIQHMANPKKEVMVIRVSESYRWGDPVEGVRPLLGEMTYSIGTGSSERTFRGVSKTWVDKDGYGFSEVTQDGKTLRYHAAMSEGSLVFIPFSERTAPKSGNSLRFENKDGVESLIVIGFQTGNDGLYRIAGKLTRVP